MALNGEMVSLTVMKHFFKNVMKLVTNDMYILEVNVVYPKHLHEFHSGLTFLPERMEI